MAKSNKPGVKGRLSTRMVTAIIYAICGLLALSMLAPFLYTVAGSFATEKELTERSFFIIPREPSLAAYQYIWEQKTIFLGLANSIKITLLGTAWCMFVTTLFAYPLSKSHLRGKNLILNIVIVTMLFSGGMIPYYLVIKSLGMLNTHAALIIPAAFSPFNMIIVKKFFEELPQELEEAAMIDGASEWTVFSKICLPLSKPVLASISLFYGVGFWNDYFQAMIYLQDQDQMTVQVLLRQIMAMSQAIQTDSFSLGWEVIPPDKAVRMASTVVATLPILLVYPFLQKHFAKGVMVGSVKG